MALTLLTQLDAVNTMLSCIGESPLTTLTSPPTSDATIAISMLDEVNRNTQSIGWFFNTEYNVPMTRAGDGTISLTTDIVRIDVDKTLYPSIDVVQKGSSPTAFYLYDKKNRTNIFTSDFKAEIIRLLDWDNLPQAFRTYITYKAARMFQQRVVGSNELSQQLAQDELNALVALREYDGDTADNNIFDAYDVSKVLQRF